MHSALVQILFIAAGVLLIVLGAAKVGGTRVTPAVLGAAFVVVGWLLVPLVATL